MKRPFACVLLLYGLMSLSACGGGDDGHNDKEIPDTTTPFAGPMTAMDRSITFNSASVGTRRESLSTSPTATATAWLRERNEDDQVSIDPAGNAFRDGVRKPFKPIFFTSGTEIYGEARIRTAEYSTVTERSIIVLLAGMQASGQEWVSHATWQSDYDAFFCFIFTCWSETERSQGSLLFGIRTPSASMPRKGIRDYSGYASGYLTTVSSGVFSRIRFKGEVYLTSDFDRGEFEVRLFGFSEGQDEIGSAELVLLSSITGIDFSGEMRGTSDCENLEGELVGSLYGPDAGEIGGVFSTHVCGQPMFGAFVARRL